MDHPDTTTGQAPARRPPRSGWSNENGRSLLIIALATVVGLVTAVGLGAGALEGAPATAATTQHGTSSHHRASSKDAPATGSPSTGGSSTGGSDLFVVDGTSGSAVRTGTDTWRLSMNGPTVLWFKDRPFRGSGAQSAQSLASSWTRYFAGSPPYGAVLAPSGPSGHHPTAIKLTSPSFDPSTGVLSFTVTPDAGESTADAAWLSKLTPATADKNGRVVLFVDDSSSTGSGSGGPAADDEELIEYFNQIEFSEDIYVLVDGLNSMGQESSSFTVTLSCPPDISPTIPGPDFDLTMTTSDNSASTTCANQEPIVFNKAQLAAKQYPSCSNGTSCNFVITFSNASTGTIYCETIVQIFLGDGNQTYNQTYIPNLEPATLPLRPSNFNPCVLTGTCPLSTTGSNPGTKLTTPTTVPNPG